jgi:nucleoside-diphosphate-sugar epimerase
MTTTPDTILITSPASPLGEAVARTLEGEGYAVRRAGGGHAVLTDPAAVAPLVQGVQAIVHLAPLAAVQAAPADAPGEALDLAARGTHVLLKAALEAGVRRVVQGSTLAVMDAYGADLEVTEQWRPRPHPVPEELAPYVAELVAREFTRDVQLDALLSVVCLRFDRLAAGGTASNPERDLPLEDAARAVAGALAALRAGTRARGHRWQVLHVAPRTSEARYTSAAAERAIGYGAEAAGSAANADAGGARGGA